MRADDSPAAAKRLTFDCNVCGATVSDLPLDDFERDAPTCECGSTVRVRSIVHLLSTALFGNSKALHAFPHDKRVVGIGLSDSPLYADELALRLDYTNTFFDTSPALDITNPPESLFATCDFVLSADVFEHVVPPAQRAFRSTYNLLKPGGVLVLTVPFGEIPETIEHYPRLADFRIVPFGSEMLVLERDVDGRYHVHADAAFHDGPGRTLEMRIYARTHLLRLLHDAGFAEVTIFSQDVPRWGIVHKAPWSLPIVARRPRS